MDTGTFIDAALRCADPAVRLREVVRQLLAQGENRDAIYAELEDFRHELRAAGREDDEDVILEVMDSLTGFCSPHTRL